MEAKPYLFDVLIVIMYTISWTIEIMILLLEIAALYIAICVVTIFGTSIYILTCTVVIFLLLIIEFIRLLEKLMLLFVKISRAVISSPYFAIRSMLTCRYGQNKTDFHSSVSDDDNIEDIKACMNNVLNQVEKILIYEKFGQRLILDDLLSHQLPEKELLRLCTKTIVERSVKSLEDDIENIQFLATVIDEMTTDSLGNLENSPALKVS